MSWILRFNDLIDISANGQLLLLENISGRNLIVFAYNPNARVTWKVACYLSYTFQLTDFSEDVTVVDATKKVVFLNEKTFIEIPDFITTYRLLLDFPKWHKSMSVKIWSRDVAMNDKTFSAEAETSIINGQPLVLQVNGKLTPASNQNFASAFANCFSASDSKAHESGDYITEGQIYRDDWRDITNTVYLVTGATYFLDVEPGKMTTVAPNEPGSIVVVLGRAISPNLFDIEIQPPILL